MKKSIVISSIDEDELIVKHLIKLIYEVIHKFYTNDCK